MPASCAGGRGTRPGRVLARFSAPFVSWPIADAAWAHQAGPHRGAHAQGARPGRQLAAQCWRRALAAPAFDRARSGPSSQGRSCRGRLRTWPGQAKPRRIEAHTLRTRNWPRSSRHIAGVMRCGRGARPGQVLGSLSSAVPVVADGRRGLGTPSRAKPKRTRSGRRPGRAARAAFPASCAGGRGARPGRGLGSLSAPFRSWPMAGAAWAPRGEPHRGARAPGAELAGRLAPGSPRCALAHAEHDRARSWASFAVFAFWAVHRRKQGSGCHQDAS
jgi:hypothetical protein